MQLYAPTSTTATRKRIARAGARQARRRAHRHPGERQAQCRGDAERGGRSSSSQRHGCTVAQARLQEERQRAGAGQHAHHGGAGGRLPDHRPGGLRVLLNVQSARRHLLRAARQAGGGDLHDTLRGDGQEHRPGPGHSRLPLHQGPAPDRLLHPPGTQGTGRSGLPAGPGHIAEGLKQPNSRRNRDAVQWVHEKSPSLPLAMGRLDAHAGYNSGAVGRARRLLECVRPQGRNHGISRLRRWSQRRCRLCRQRKGHGR